MLQSKPRRSGNLRDTSELAPSNLRLREVFNEVEKAYDALWMENQELRHQLEHAKQQLAALQQSGAIERTGEAQVLIDQPDSNKKDKISASARVVQKKLEAAYKASTSKFAANYKHRTAESSIHRLYMQHRDGIWEVSSSYWPASHFIGSASADRKVRIWDTTTGSCLYVYKGHAGSVNSIRFGPIPGLVCSASGDGSCHVWRVTEPTAQQTSVTRDYFSDSDVLGERPLRPSKRVASSEDTRVASESSEHQIRPRSSSVGKSLAADLPRIERQTSHPTLAGQHGSVDGSLTNLEAMPPVTRSYTVSAAERVLAGGHQEPLSSADWLGSGDAIVTGSWDRTLKVWSVETGSVIATMTGVLKVFSFFSPCFDDIQNIK
eukprot:Colp12_sorted_trinity150504_noHs@10154